MPLGRDWVALTVGLTVMTAAWSGCMQDPAARKAHYLGQAERYMADEQYPEAVIEYRNALKLDPKDAHAYFKLGIAYLSQHPITYAQPAFAALSKAVELDPSLWEAQLRVGELQALGRQFDAAEAKARLVLDQRPQELDALMLLAKSQFGQQHRDAAQATVTAAKAAHPREAKPWLAEAALALDAKDYRASERALREAIRLAPTSVDPVMALANLYRLEGKHQQAEAQYRSAISLNPSSPGLHLTLAQFYADIGNTANADEVFQHAIKTFPSHAAGRLAYARFLIVQGNADGAADQYRAVLKGHPRDTVAKKQLTALLLDQQRLDDARPLVDELTADRRGDPDVLHLSARLMIADKDYESAVSALQSALRADPDHAAAHQTLGFVFAKRGDIQQAKSELSAAVQAQPTAWDARLALASLHLRSNAPDLALEQARAVLVAVPKHPLALQLAGDALAAKGNHREAMAEYDALVAVAPENYAGYFRKAIVYRAMAKPSEAETQFRAALERAPGSPDVVEQLVALLVQRQEHAQAIALLKDQIAKNDHLGAFHYMLGTVYAAIDRRPDAEAEFKRAIELDKSLLAAYEALAQLYARGQNPDQVIAQYRAMVEAAPAKASPHLLLGMAYEAQQRYDDAMAEYREALRLDPQFAPAANNLAWLYAERGQNLDVALTLAQTAMEQLPSNPGVADTLGWLYYKKGAYLKAVALLRESSEKLPENAVIRYHLGMALHKNGDAPAAKRELKRALALDPRFPGSEEARQVLAALK